MTDCGCTLAELKSVYSLEDALSIWEPHYVAKYNEYTAFLKKQKEIESASRFNRR